MDELVFDGEVFVDDFEGDDVCWVVVLFGVGDPEVDSSGAADTQACPHEVRAEA
jgi:hypothetical protein